jgi:hypothetical protein
MITNRSLKKIFVDQFDLQEGFICPECGKFYLPNGTGPTNKRLLSKILKWLPSEIMVGGIPPRLHDACYALCSVGWIVLFQVSSGKVVEVKTKAQSDKLYFSEMMAAHNDAKGLAWAMLYAAAKRNYWAAKYDGKSSFRHEH